MRILDLFCGAGGSAAGYARVFTDADIMGVDTKNQPNYPFFFKKADALTERLTGYDLINASPPCQDHTRLRGRTGGRDNGWMLQATADLLAGVDALWVIENVSAASMPPAPHTVMLCGSMFGLDVRRHRYFATNFPVWQPECRHHEQLPRFPSINYHTRMKGVLSPVVGVHGNLQYAGELEVRRKAMDIDWMTGPELAQSIPPAYTEHIAWQAWNWMQQ